MPTSYSGWPVGPSRQPAARFRTHMQNARLTHLIVTESYGTNLQAAYSDNQR